MKISHYMTYNMAIYIKCPICGEELSLNPKQNIEKCLFDCPKCKETIKLSDSIPKFSLLHKNKKYQLHWGNNSIGRDYPDSDKDIRFVDTSMQMSRYHANITVTSSNLGTNITLEDFGVNPTIIQGVELVNRDIVYLSPNDSIQMGQVLIYLIDEYGD